MKLNQPGSPSQKRAMKFVVVAEAKHAKLLPINSEAL